MKRIMTFLALAAITLASQAVMGQSADARARAQAKLAPLGSVTTTTVTGRFIFLYTIAIHSNIPMTDVITCVASASTDDLTTGKIIEEEASVAATRTSAGVAKCEVLIPYSWTLATGNSDMVNLTYTIEVPGPGTPAAQVLPGRISTQSIGSIPVPLNGAQTTYTLTPAI